MARGRKKDPRREEERKMLAEAYRKARHAAIQRRSAAKKAGKKVPKLPKKVKNPTEASILRMEQYLRKAPLKESRYIKKSGPLTKMEAEIKGARDVLIANGKKAPKLMAKATKAGWFRAQEALGRMTQTATLVHELPKNKKLRESPYFVTYGDIQFDNIMDDLRKYADDENPLVASRSLELVEMIGNYKEAFHNVTDKTEADMLATIASEAQAYIFDSDNAQRQNAMDQIYRALDKISFLSEKDKDTLEARQQEMADTSALTDPRDDIEYQEYEESHDGEEIINTLENMMSEFSLNEELRARTIISATNSNSKAKTSKKTQMKRAMKYVREGGQVTLGKYVSGWEDKQ